MNDGDRQVLQKQGGIAVVTGAGSGIGRALVLGLAARAMPCCLVGRTVSKLQDVAKLAAQAGVESIPVELDLCEPAAPAILSERLKALGRPIELLVHSAAVMNHARIEESTAEDFTKLLTVNLLAPFSITKHLLAEICACKGQVVFVNSSIVQNAAAGTLQYAASKHALKGLADGLRQEVNGKGVRVISVYPGRTATPLQASIAVSEGRQYLPENLLQPADVAEIIISAIALPDTAEVTDVMIRPAKKHPIT
jgi:short-subunit dehydrogenase